MKNIYINYIYNKHLVINNNRVNIVYEHTALKLRRRAGLLTFSPTWNSTIKTLSIGRMDNFKTLTILVQMLSFRNKTQKTSAILTQTILACCTV